MEKNYAYFYTISINNRVPLLADDNLKKIVIESWQYLLKERIAEITNRSTSIILPSIPFSNTPSLSLNNVGNILKRMEVGTPKARPRKNM